MAVGRASNLSETQFSNRITPPVLHIIVITSMALFKYDNIVILVFLLTSSNIVSQEDRNVFLVTDTIQNGD